MNKNVAIPLFALFSIIVGLLSASNPVFLLNLLLLVSCMLFHIFRIQFSKIYVFIVFGLIMFSGFIQMLFLQFNLISSHTNQSTIIYYFPIFYIWFYIIFNKKLVNLRFKSIDYIGIILFVFLLILTIVSKNNNIDFFILVMSFLKISLFLPAFFFGRIIYFDFKKINFAKISMIFTVFVFVIGIFDVLSNHGILIQLGFAKYLGSDTYGDQSMSVFYKQGMPRMMSAFLSPLTLGMYCGLMIQYWYYKLVANKSKFYLIGFLLTAVMLLLSLTRASWISAVLGIGLLSLFLKNKRKIFFFNNFFLYALLIILLPLLLYKDSSYFAQLLYSDTSTDGHIVGLNNGLIAIKNNFWWGNGIGISPYFGTVLKSVNNNFESWYLDIIYNVGFIFVLLFNLFALIGIKSIKKSSDKYLLVSIYVTLTIEAIFENHAWYQTIAVLAFWASLGYQISKCTERSDLF
ncbi:O-antigen ligase family protein [Sporolactobacillus inulinus]|uniref:O-antigen ligase family protein n=1 Tax=Sporolactobacillus inulinus TaxID=2078 RepID=UPI0002F6516F|nr:O-antigen ligase family protein [Sporolactobacillus inulinus]